MSNIRYNKEKVIEVILEYFYEHGEECISMPIEKVYSEIVRNTKTDMPKFAQARKIIIAEIGLKTGEKFTSANVYNTVKSDYYNEKNICDVLWNEYTVYLNSHEPIVCIIKLPPKEFIENIFKNKADFMQVICKKIKRKNKNIIAVIPENSEICDTLCMFVKNNSGGRAFVEKIKNSPHSLTKIVRE